jgi:hypothetical protein
METFAKRFRWGESLLFPGPWGVPVPRNITSSKTKGTGLGGWSDAEIKRAITQGLHKDGTRLEPPMGFGIYPP